MTIVGGSLADLWRNEERGVPMAAFSAAPFLGPAIGELRHIYIAASIILTSSKALSLAASLETTKAGDGCIGYNSFSPDLYTY